MFVKKPPKKQGVPILPHFCVGMKNKKMDFGATLGGSAITGLVLAAGYALIKLLKRSRCASHTKCCDLDITRTKEYRSRFRGERLEQTKLEEGLNTV